VKISTEHIPEVRVVIEQLLRDSNANAVFLTDADGTVIVEDGETETLDPVNLLALSVIWGAETSGLEEPSPVEQDSSAEFEHSFKEGSQHSYHLTRIRKAVILIVVFDQRSSLGLIRLRTLKARAELERLLFADDSSGQGGGGPPGGGRGGGGSGGEARVRVWPEKDIGWN